MQLLSKFICPWTSIEAICVYNFMNLYWRSPTEVFTLSITIRQQRDNIASGKEEEHLQFNFISRMWRNLRCRGNICIGDSLSDLPAYWIHSLHSAVWEISIHPPMLIMFCNLLCFYLHKWVKLFMCKSFQELVQKNEGI